MEFGPTRRKERSSSMRIMGLKSEFSACLGSSFGKIILRKLVAAGNGRQ